MPIKCQICNQEFPKIISSTHLKSHNITSAEYRSQYGLDSLASPEYRAQRSQQSSGKNNPNYGNTMSEQSRQAISEKNQGKTVWNKGIKMDNTDAYKIAAKHREAKYQRGELHRKTHDYTPATRAKISKSVKKYAEKNPEIMSQRARKATETKRDNGYDLAFFRGKHHTPETKHKIAQAARKNNEKKSQESNVKAKANAALARCSIVCANAHVYHLRCDICGHEFSRTRQYLTATGKFTPELCEVCHPRNHKTSQIEVEIAEYMTSLGVEIIQNTRTVLPSKKEIDIFVPERNLAIEVNGVYWHSQTLLESNGYSRTKDHEKYLEASNAGIKMITVYDTEWLSKPDIVRSRLSGLVGKNQSVGARKTVVREISSRTANQFLKQNHIQGSGRSNVRYGLFLNDQLVSVMTFSRENISRNLQVWEINRFCNLLGMTVAGGASKLFKAFVSDHDPVRVISYSDNRWGDGQMYQNLGFHRDGATPPNYWYHKPNDIKLYHRYSLRKNIDDDQSLTEWQNRQQQGWNRIWDCGSTRWIYDLRI